MATALPWWKITTVYQIYPRSFCDSNGDGIGDIPGIISKLDYLHDLGVETIWFSPFFKSPQRDFGYDTSDYEDIAPEYGMMQDCEKLIAELHNRGMKIIFDLVINHTSDQHPWFLESRSSRDNPKRDWYLWRDGKKPHGKVPPNNWLANPGGRAWHYDVHTDQWYYAAFLDFQPDLNFRNPAVKAAIFEMVRFWLRKGVDGFRLDMIGAIYEDEQFRNNPFTFQLMPTEDSWAMLFQKFSCTNNLPETFQFCRELRAVIDEFQDPPRVLIGETFGSQTTLRQFCGTPDQPGLNLAFLFKTLDLPLEALAVQKFVKRTEQNFPTPYLPTYVFANHDRTRRITRLGNNEMKAKLNIAFQLTVRGVPFIYYGEEIGMQQVSIPIRASQDAVAERYKSLPPFFTHLLELITNNAIHRDGCRTPMQWSSAPHAGFSTGEKALWLPLHPDFAHQNVEQQNQKPDSIYHCYKRFLQIRGTYPALHAGELSMINPTTVPKSVVAYTRTAEMQGKSQIISIYLNMSSKATNFSAPTTSLALLASTLEQSDPIQGNMLRLSPYEGIVMLHT